MKLFTKCILVITFMCIAIQMQQAQAQNPSLGSIHSVSLNQTPQTDLISKSLPITNDVPAVKQGKQAAIIHQKKHMSPQYILGIVILIGIYFTMTYRKSNSRNADF